MSFLGDLVGDALGNLFVGGRTDRKLERLMAEGELLTARIDAIRLVEHGDTADEWYYGLAFQTASGAQRVTVRQQLTVEPQRATLGASVLIRHADGRVAIDWPATLMRDGLGGGQAVSFPTKQLREPIPPGVDDRGLDRKRLDRGTRIDATVDSAEPVLMLGMPTDRWSIELTLREPAGDRGARLSRARVPAYAQQLLGPGSTIPVAVDPSRPDRITIDWATAAERATA